MSHLFDLFACDVVHHWCLLDFLHIICGEFHRKCNMVATFVCQPLTGYTSAVHKFPITVGGRLCIVPPTIFVTLAVEMSTHTTPEPFIDLTMMIYAEDANDYSIDDEWMPRSHSMRHTLTLNLKNSHIRGEDVSGHRIANAHWSRSQGRSECDTT